MKTKLLTVKELIEQLQALVATGQVQLDAWINMEGCGCCDGYTGAVTVLARPPNVSVYGDDGRFIENREALGPAVFLERVYG